MAWLVDGPPKHPDLRVRAEHAGFQPGELTLSSISTKHVLFGPLPAGEGVFFLWFDFAGNHCKTFNRVAGPDRGRLSDKSIRR